MLAAPAALAACANGVAREELLASPSEVERVRYVHPGPKSLTLFTMKNTGSDNGAHSGLMINASQRVLWDPAGSFGHASIPERNDVHFGITPRIEQFYISYHSRITFYTLIQYIEVSPEVAEQALQLAITNGPTPRSLCTTHTSRMLAQLPGFEGVRTTIFPNNLADQISEIPGVIESEYRETDSDDKEVAAAQINAAITTDQ